MFVPFITRRNPNRRLERRKGGGRGGGGGKSSGGGGKSSGGSSSKSGSKSGSSSSSSAKTGPAKSVSAGGSSVTVKSYSSGGGRTSVIPAGQLFAGRSQGGGSRAQIFGNRVYGSGYPGILGRGVRGRPFPFFFWPIVWIGGGTLLYLHETEYGDVDNPDRPGGSLSQAAFVSHITNTTLHIVSDNTTTTSLIDSIRTNCSTNLAPSSSTVATPYLRDLPGQPQPEQAVQYYRASSVVLTLDGYNNTASLSGDDNAPDDPLPLDIDHQMLNCVNQTIGAAAPLQSGAGIRWATSPVGAIGAVWLMWFLLLF